VRAAVAEGKGTISALVLGKGEAKSITLRLGALTDDERQIILDGCLINFYRGH